MREEKEERTKLQRQLRALKQSLEQERKSLYKELPEGKLKLIGQIMNSEVERAQLESQLKALNETELLDA